MPFAFLLRKKRLKTVNFSQIKPFLLGNKKIIWILDFRVVYLYVIYVYHIRTVHSWSGHNTIFFNIYHYIMRRIILSIALLCAYVSVQAQHTLQVDNGAGKVGAFNVSGLTTNRTYTLPDVTGTVLVFSGPTLTINGNSLTWPTTATGFLYNDGAGSLSWGSAVASVTGTANRISIGGTAINPIVDISASYVGQNTITTLGTIGTGVWQGTLVAPPYGGTGVNGVAAANGTLLIGNGAGYTLATPTAGSGITITPEKGGVGPLTVCALFDNVLRAARESN